MIRDSVLNEIAESMPITFPEGHHDLWRIYSDGNRLRRLIEILVAPFRSDVDIIVGGEARGFLLGGMAALHLGIPFVPVRKPGTFLPGSKLTCMSDPDWEQKQTLFSIQKHAIQPNQRALIVDDWYTTGSQAKALQQLIQRAGGSCVGVAVIVEEGDDMLGQRIGPLHALLRWQDSSGEFSVSPFNRLHFTLA
ncbi:phosphoribosyltransferase family protein [Streptomyces sp. FL07-04A]|uniref:phosphoribosyltransferase family protein n=1 Tax=Streptomyces sp. FL07-04A TaxID=3028658 RepID=UPI0029A32AA9|nr:phosphoribosyltransferase family protein [Streptomyces sp. FL07-04A]MDX3579188.1 phosphoribosyltransferase family protein [Streptomyces sp. FL07-04A]